MSNFNCYLFLLAILSNDLFTKHNVNYIYISGINYASFSILKSRHLHLYDNDTNDCGITNIFI